MNLPRPVNLPRPTRLALSATLALLVACGCRPRHAEPADRAVAKPASVTRPTAGAQALPKRLPMDYRGPRGQTALHMAAQRGDLAEMRRLVDAGLAVDVNDGDRRTPLFEAVEYAQLDAVRWLLAGGADPNTKSFNGHTPLFSAARMAVQSGSFPSRWPMGPEVRRKLTEAGRLLLEAGADPKAATEDERETPLHFATRTNPDLARLLLDAGADVNAIARTNGSPLRVAASARDPGTVRLLLERGADVRVGDDRERQLLVQAACGDTEVMRLLLAAGLDLSGDRGKSAVYLSATGARPQVLAQLIGRDFVTPEVLGSALLSAASADGGKRERPGDRLAVVKMLLDAGAPVNHPHDTGAALVAAAHKRHDDVIKLLQERGARYRPENVPPEVKARQPQGAEKYVSWLALEDKPDVARRLVAIGAELDVASAAAYGYADRVRQIIRDDPAAVNGIPSASPLSFAARGGHLEVVKLLLEAGAEVNPKFERGGWFGAAPLETAASRGHLDVMRTLIEHGADVNVRDEHGDTLLKRLRQRARDNDDDDHPVNPAALDLLRRHDGVE